MTIENELSKIIKVSPSPIIKSAVSFGIIVLVVFFGSFVLWTFLSSLETAAIAPGKVTVDTNRKTVQHLEGGIIKKIYIREDSRVKAGDLLIKLDDTQSNASLTLLKGRTNELLAAEARLKTERDGLKKIEFPEKLLKQSKSSKVKNILKGQRNIFKASRRSVSGRIKILNQRIVQLEKEIESLNAQVTSESKQLELIEEEIVAVKFLEKKKLIEKPRLLALQREAARLLGNRGEHLGLIAKARQKIGETQSQIITVQDDHLKNTLIELRETQQQLADLLQKEKAAQDILDRTEIRAPKSGRIVGLRQHTVGGVIIPGGEVLDIVPSDDKLIIEARINPLDIDIVHEGLLAKIKLTAFKQRHTPTIEGIVTHISADSFQDEKTNESFYRVTIDIPPEELKKIKGLKLYPGMPTQVMIIVDDRSPFSYFFSPIRDSFSRAFKEQ